MLARTTRDPDRLHQLFVSVSSDLSYAQTFYPNRSVRRYLNNLTQKVFDTLSTKGSRFYFRDLLHFFSKVLPQEVYRSRMAFRVSLWVFVISVLVGALSSAHNDHFARVILGDTYVDMTEANINHGDPMAVYKDEAKVDMFLGITINNIKVAFLAFILGLIGGIGTIIVLVSNGIMLGAFQYFFFSKGLFLTSFLTIWIHGTIEISAIIIAGAAGIILGNGLLFPRTYKRLQSLQTAARSALIIVLGTMPLFVLAGILEAFVTRQTAMPDSIKWAIILLSLTLIIVMWVILPRRVGASSTIHHEPPSASFSLEDMTAKKYRSHGENFILSFIQLQASFGSYLRHVLIPSLLLLAILNWYHFSFYTGFSYELDQDTLPFFTFTYAGVSNFIFGWVTLSMANMFIAQISRKKAFGYSWSSIKENLLTVLLTLTCLFPFYFLNFWIGCALLFILSIQFVFIAATVDAETTYVDFSRLEETYVFCLVHYFKFVAPLLMIFLLYELLWFLFSSGLAMFIKDFFSWHDLFGDRLLDALYIDHLLAFIVLMLMLPFAGFLLINEYESIRCRVEARDLRAKFRKFGQSKKIMEG